MVVSRAADRLAHLLIARSRDRAGIDHDDVGFFPVSGRFVSVSQQIRQHRLRFVLIDLAAERNDPDFHFKSFQIPLKCAKQLVDAQTDAEKDSIIIQTLKETLYKFSFESEQTVEYAMSYIGIRNIWTKLSTNMGIPTSDIKTQLNLIVRRRNNIAHQSDISNLMTMEKDQINRSDVEGVITFIEALTRNIDAVISAEL